MCGIYGIYSRQVRARGKEDQVRRAVSGMTYRGPDEEGFYDDDQVSLGIRRLAIVDVAGGRQPHVNESQDSVLICNGQIYNHTELRKRLEQKGHQFKTRSDTEVILHLYEEKGIHLLEDLSGMFAFALWDSKKKSLFLARDRVGIKPLYIYNGKGMFVFSSEMKTLINSLALNPRILPEKVWEYLAYGFPVDNRQTLQKDIIRLMPGQGCRISETSERYFTYWNPSYMMPGKADGRASMAEIESLYARSLNEHLSCEVPSAVMLSGGLDSASIVSLGHEQGHSPPALTVGYDGDFPGDERARARQIAGRYKLHLNEIVLNYEAYASAFDDLMHFTDEPVADIASIPQWVIFKHAKQMGIKVLVNGLGGDELFYGYGLWNEATQLTDTGKYQPFFSDDDASGFFFHPAYRAARNFLDRCGTAGFKKSGTGLDQEFLDRHDGQHLTAGDRIYHLIFKTWLPNNCLLLSDRLSMAHSIELRVPMLDHRLVDYIQGLPYDERFFGARGKVLLEQLLEPRLPSSFIRLPRQGFTPPGIYMKNMVFSNKELILESDLVQRQFKRAALEKLWANETYLEIWFRLLVFAKWQQHTFH